MPVSPGRKVSKSGKSKKGEAKQKRQEQGEIPTTPKSPDIGPPTIKSEGACGQSPTAEDSEHLEESQYDNSEEADGAESKPQASGGHRTKQDKDKKDIKGKGRKGKKQEEYQDQTRSASRSKCSDKRTSHSSQHPLSLSEAPPPPQRHHTHSESSQGGHSHVNIIQDATLEEGAKEASSKALGVKKYLCIYLSGGFRWALYIAKNYGRVEFHLKIEVK